METRLLNNGMTVPALGFGVFQSAADETAEAVRCAIETGYRLIDTAAVYGNEREVGEGIRRSDVAREDIIIETKIWVSDYGRDATLHAFDKASAKLGVDTIDILILHHPGPTRRAERMDAYHALEELYADGRVRAIGVSNFMPHHMEEFLPEIDVVPSLNQVEIHPYFQQPAVQATNAANGILTQAWSPIGGMTFYGSYGTGYTSVMDEPVLADIAVKHGRSKAQVMLRWHLQEGRAAIPKSTKPHRIAENFAVFDFDLDEQDLASIDALDTGVRAGPDPDVFRDTFDRPIPQA